MELKIPIWQWIIYGLAALLAIGIFVLAYFDFLSYTVAIEIVVPLIIISILIFVASRYMKGSSTEEILKDLQLDDDKAIAKASTVFKDNGLMILREDMKLASGMHGTLPSLIFVIRGKDFWNGKEYVCLVIAGKFNVRTSFIPEANPKPEMIDKYLNESSEKPERLLTKRKSRENMYTGTRETEEEIVPESDKKEEELEEKEEEQKT
jgi:hypothetical protein